MNTFLYELLKSFLNSRNRPPSIVLPCSRLRKLILVSDQLQLRPLFRISEVVANESFDCIFFFFVLFLSVQFLCFVCLLNFFVALGCSPLFSLLTLSKLARTYLLWLLLHINVEKIIAIKNCHTCQDFNPDLCDTGAGLYRLRWQDSWEMVIKLVYDIPRKNELCQFHIFKLQDEEINVRGSSQQLGAGH